MFKKILIVAVLILLFSACGKNDTSIKGSYTNQNITKEQIQLEIGNYFGADFYSDENYEIVNYDWLVNNFYPYYKQALFDEDITNWNPSFECTMFCDYYISKLNALYYRDHWNSYSKSTQLAVAEFWYKPSGPNKPGHSILRIRTDKGWIFIDPQLPQQNQIINLTADQINTHMLEKF